MPRVRGIDPIAVRFEHGPRGVERLRARVQVARDQRDLGLGHNTPRAGHRLLRTEGARCISQERLRSNEIAELRHRDAAQREGRRVITQGDAIQSAEGITRCECTRRGRDQRVHRNPVTPVAPGIVRSDTNRLLDWPAPTGSRSQWIPEGGRRSDGDAHSRREA